MSATGRRVIVSGANGFVGRAVVRDLQRAAFDVIPVVRRPSTGLGSPAPYCLEDQGSAAAWRRVVEGADAVIHLAAHAHRGERMGPEGRSLFAAVNCDITEALARACQAEGVARFVFMSSVKVFGEASPRTADGRLLAFNAHSPTQPAGPYGETKLAAERMLVEILKDTALCVLRPPLVYGPGMRGNLLVLLAAVARGVPLPFAAIDNRRSLVHRDTVSLAIRRCLGLPFQTGPRCFTLADLEVSTPGLVRLLATGLGRSARMLPVAPSILRLAGRLCRREAQVARLLDSLVIEGQAARDALALDPVPDPAARFAEIGTCYLRGKEAWQWA
jgi:nucleoside-diphosphate-sugar epimerase